MPHPQLWPAWIGAVLGCVFIIWARGSWRRGPVARTALTLFALAYALNLYAWLIEPRFLVVSRVEIVSEQWRGAPLTIAALGDTHVGGPHVDPARIARVVRRINALNPDLVVVLGDYVGGTAPMAARAERDRQEIVDGIAAFADLTAPLGVVGVLGNHDCWYGCQAITRALEDAGVTVLWNSNFIIARAGGDVAVAGLADLETGHPDFERTLTGIAGMDTIVISHSPDRFGRMPRGPAAMLAAHSHCGQVTVPFWGRPILPLRHRQYACHLVQENGNVLYVTAGLGTSILPVRFLNPPEIVLVTLRGR